MAILKNGLLGKAKGKIGGIVTATWRGINYAREYVIPANPKTVNQTAIRTVFSNVVLIGRASLTDFIHTYWNELMTGKPATGWSKFVGTNMQNVTISGAYENLKLSTGDLEGLASLAEDGSPPSNQIKMNWNESVVSNGEQSDIVIIRVFCIDRGYIYSQMVSATRHDATCSIEIPNKMSAGTLFIYVQCYNASGLYSNTQGFIAH